MSKTLTAFLDECELSLNDVANSVWTRATLIAWAKEAILAFPILRGKIQNYVETVEGSKETSLLADFRQIISIEHPIDQTPPEYLIRKNRFDPDFYNAENYYDIDYDFSAGKGYTLYLSFSLAVDEEMNIEYLTLHDSALDDDGSDTLSVHDEHVHILLAYVLMKAYEERLSTYMQDTTAYSQIITQMTQTVTDARLHYYKLIEIASSRLDRARHSMRWKSDDYDRVY